jgi:hypothetical protein
MYVLGCCSGCPPPWWCSLGSVYLDAASAVVSKPTMLFLWPVLRMDNTKAHPTMPAFALVYRWLAYREGNYWTYFTYLASLTSQLFALSQRLVLLQVALLTLLASATASMASCTSHTVTGAAGVHPRRTSGIHTFIGRYLGNVYMG